jgi:hypothetical protein
LVGVEWLLGVQVSVKRDGRALSGAKVRLSAWKIGSRSDLPEHLAAAQGAGLETGPDGTARFSLELPASLFFDAKAVWLRASLASAGRKASVDRRVVLDLFLCKGEGRESPRYSDGDVERH